MMRKLLVWSVATFVALASLAVLASSVTAESPQPQTKTCKARYTGPLNVILEDDGLSLTLKQPYGFGDSNCYLWLVPAGASSDGASIPPIFRSMIGGPLEGKYRSAAVIHDWFCNRMTQPWQRVHRVLYEAMLASGVEPFKAKMMYAAVLYKGPRWTEQQERDNTLVNQEVSYEGTDPAMKHQYKLVANFKNSKISAGVRYIADSIEQNDISLDEIDRLAEQARAEDGLSDVIPPPL